MRNDKTYKTWVVAKKGDLYTLRDNRGKNGGECIYVRHDPLFSPDVKWTDCRGYADGTQKVKLDGSPWPMKVGNKWSYKVKGKDKTGESWKTTRKCKVTSAVAIETSLGNTDTFKVVCKDSWKVRTYYVSAADSFLVYMHVAGKDGSKQVKWERSQLVYADG